MDKVTCMAFILYHSSENNTIREYAIGLLNGDVTLRDAESNHMLQSQLALAELQYKKKKPKQLQVQAFAAEFMLVEV